MPLAAAIGAAIYILGRILLLFSPKVGARLMKRYILPVLRASLRWLKEQAIDISMAALTAAIEFVLDFLTGSTKELGKYINKNSSQLTKQGSPNATSGRQPNYRHFYRQPIPYRPIICRILCFANSNPIPGRRTKKSDKTKPESTTTDFPKLRQLAATMLFELMDWHLDWKSPLKADLMYINRQAQLVQPDFRPERVYFSYKRKKKSSISPDIAIVEDRHKPPTLDNLFAIVEVKFKGDSFDKNQQDAYGYDFPDIPLALIRVPEDCKCGNKKKKP